MTIIFPGFSLIKEETIILPLLKQTITNMKRPSLTKDEPVYYLINTNTEQKSIFSKGSSNGWRLFSP